MEKMKNVQINRVLTVISCVFVQLCVGILYLWSVLKIDVQNFYNFNASSANYVSAFMIFGFVFGNLIGGILQDKTNPKLVIFLGALLFCLGIILTSFLNEKNIYTIYLTYSGVSGLGCGFSYIAVLKTLQKWFPSRRGFASGISVSSFGISTVIFTPISQMLLKNFDVPIVFRILGISFLIVTMTACLFIRLPKEENNLQNISKNNADLTPKEAIKKGAFWCIFISNFFVCGLWNILIPIIKPLGESRNLAPTVAGVVVMITGLTNALGRIGMASLSDKFKRSHIVIAMSSITMTCAILLIFAQSYFYLVVLAFAAMSFGGPSAVKPAMLVDLTGTRYSGTNYGIIMLSLGLSSVTFTFISNFLFDTFKTYTYSFILAAIVCVIPVICMIIYDRLYKKQKLQQEKQEK